MGFKDQRPHTGMRRYWPVVGFIMMIALAAIAYIVAPTVQAAMRSMFPAFNTGSLDPTLVRVGYAVVIFFVLALVSGALVAVAQPKRQMNIKDKDLLKAREEMLQKKEADKLRMRKINRKMREQ